MMAAAGRKAAIAATIASAMAMPAFPQGFFDLYRSAPERAEDALRSAASRPAAGRFDTPGPVSTGIPSLTQVASLSVPEDFGSDTLVPSLGQTSIPTTTGRMVASSAPMAASAPRGDMGACVAAIRAAEKRHGIPENLLMAIGLQEAGRERDGQLTIWPWSVNSHGKTSMFETRSQAVAFVRSEQASGKTLIDVGCMQINLRWHPDAFATLDEAFDPRASAEYAARFLSGLHADAGDWMKAAGNYHSVTPEHHRRYLTGIRRNLDVALAYADEFDALSGPDTAFRNDFPVAAATSFGQNRGVSLAGGRGYGRRMVALQQPAAPPPETFPEISPQDAPPRVTGAWWSSDSGGDMGARSIYSRKDLRPAIPDLNKESPNMGT